MARPTARVNRIPIYLYLLVVPQGFFECGKAARLSSVAKALIEPLEAGCAVALAQTPRNRIF